MGLVVWVKMINDYIIQLVLYNWKLIFMVIKEKWF